MKIKNKRISKTSNKTKKCSKCKLIKSINEFQYGRKGYKYQYIFSYCTSCRKFQTYLNLNSDINKFLSDRYNRLKRRCKQKNIKITLTKKDLIAIYNNQKGKCYYTNELLSWKVGEGLKRNSLSIDKIITKKGYIKGNVVLCTHKVNTIKNDLTLKELKKWIPKWYQKIKQKLK